MDFGFKRPIRFGGFQSRARAAQAYLRRQPWVFNVLVLASVPIMFFVFLTLRRSVQNSGAVQEEFLSIPACSARLAAAGLEFGDTPELDLRVSVNPFAALRRDVYEKMGQSIQNGLVLGGVITQGLTQDDLFVTRKDARSGQIHIEPVLKPLPIPVRALILPLRDSVVASRITAAMHSILLPVLPAGGVWLQDDSLYHATLYHASSHAVPVPTDDAGVRAEHNIIQGVMSSSCPILAILERFVVTGSGVVVACWQALPGGSEPADLRKAVGRALITAPGIEGQMVKEPAMLHTTVARLLQPPHGRNSSDGVSQDVGIDSAAVVAAVQEMTDRLCGLQTMFREVWFVEEQDLLALALNGRYRKHLAPMTCPVHD